MNALLVGALAVGGAYLLSQPKGQVLKQTLGAGAAASASSLPRTVCGVDWATTSGIDPAVALDPINVLDHQWDAMTAALGADPQSDLAWQTSSIFDTFGTSAGRTLPLAGTNCLRELVDQWLAALRAAIAASPGNLSLAAGCSSASVSKAYLTAAREGRAPAALVVLRYTSGCGSADAFEDDVMQWTGLSSLGRAACNLAAWRKSLDSLDPSIAGVSATLETFQLLIALAGEMSGVDVVPEGFRPDDNPTGINWSWSNVSGALGAAGDATAKRIGGEAGQVVGSVVGSGVFWAVAFGVIAWKVLL